MSRQAIRNVFLGLQIKFLQRAKALSKAHQEPHQPGTTTKARKV